MTKTEICNRALAVLGHDRTVTDYDGRTDGGFNDNSTEAERCRQFLPSAILDCLAEHDWDFAAVVKGIGNVTPDAFGWARFPKPHDAVRICEVVNGEGKPYKSRRTRDFIEVKSEGNPVFVRYVTDDVDVAEFPHKFREAVIYRLAFLLCGPMYADDGKTSNVMRLADAKLADAVTKEADETAYRGAWDNPFIRARRS